MKIYLLQRLLTMRSIVKPPGFVIPPIYYPHIQVLGYMYYFYTARDGFTNMYDSNPCFVPLKLGGGIEKMHNKGSNNKPIYYYHFSYDSLYGRLL